MFRKAVLAAAVSTVAAAGIAAPAADAAPARKLSVAKKVRVTKPLSCVVATDSAVRPVCVFKRDISVELTDRTGVALDVDARDLRATGAAITLPVKIDLGI